MLSFRLPLLVATALALLVGCNSEIPLPKNPPEALIDYARTALNTPVTLAPLANDFDADDPVLTIVEIGTPAHGTAVLNPNQTVTYTPNTGYLGPDSFTVTVLDGHKHEVTESAYITVGDSVRFIYISNFVDYFTRQVYMSDNAHPGVAIPVSGRMAVTDGPDTPGMGVPNGSFSVMQSADGEAVVYVADMIETGSILNLFYVDLDQPAVPIQLTTLVSGQAPGLVFTPRISPDHLYVYYVSNEFNPDVFEIVRVEVANPANKVRMNPALIELTLPTTPDPTEVYESIGSFDLSPDGTTLVYVKFDPDLMTATSGGRELYAVDTTTPGVATKLSGTATVGTGGVVESTITGLGFKFLPGTTQLVYPSAEGGSLVTDLYLVDYLTPAAPVKLSGTSLAGGVISFKFTPDGTRIVYQSNQVVSTVHDIYMVEIATPGVTTQLSAPRTAEAAVQVYMMGVDSSYVVYTSDEDTVDVSDLYFVDFANPTVRVKLSHTLRAGAPPIPAEEVLTWLQSSPGDPRSVMYATNDAPVVGVSTRQTLRKVSVDVPTTNVTVGSGLAVQYIYNWHPDGDTVVGFDDPEQRGAVSAFEMKISDAAHRIKLTQEQFGGASVEININFPFLP